MSLIKVKIANTILAVSLILAFVSGGYLLSVYYKDQISLQYWKQISEQAEQTLVVSDNEIIPSLRTLYHKNQDLVGWVRTIDGHIDYPVMQTKTNPEYYLRRDFDKNDNYSGVPFVDYRCNIIPEQGFNTIIYGHYSNGNRMFRWLLNYTYQKWYEEHKYIQFDILTAAGTYEVVSVFYFDATDAVLMEEWDETKDNAYSIYNYINIDSVDGFIKFKNIIKNLSLFETDRELTMDAPIITLICCAPSEFSDIDENGRFAVIAQKVRSCSEIPL